MAKKMQGVFVVTPCQFDEDESVIGLKFSDASKASGFADSVRKFAARQYRKMAGIPADQDVNGLAFDILVQSVNSDGEAAGDPMILSTVRDAIKGSKPRQTKPSA